MIGERLVTPGAFVQLVFKLRLASPLADNTVAKKLDTEDKTAEEEADKAFLISKNDTEEIPGYEAQWAHAPHWPAVSIFIHFFFLSSHLIYSSPEPQSWMVVRRW